MNVLSLFDGISCGQIALNRAGIAYDNYFASEIDPNAIKVTQHNYPATIQLGDVTRVSGKDLPKIDLLIGGSPCQGFSSAGKGLNFEDPRSKLFFEYVRLLKETEPRYFLLENVKMKKEYQDVISSYLGVEPVEINSSLVSAQNRVRLYWSNTPISQPEDKNILLRDIIHSLNNPAAIRGRYFRGDQDLGRTKKGDPTDIKVHQCLEVGSVNKTFCLTTAEKDSLTSELPPGRYKDAFKNKLPFRYYSLSEYCKLQTVPETYFDNIVSESQAKKMIGNAWTVDVIVHIFNSIKEIYK